MPYLMRGHALALALVTPALFLPAAACTVDQPAIAAALGIKSLARFLTIEAANCAAMSVHGDAVEFRLPVQAIPVAGGVRTEVALDYPFVEGDTVRYGWDLRIPAGFRGDAPRNRWWSVAQWHDQPDRRIGETWATFPGRSPPLSVYLEERADGIGIGLRTNDAGARSWTRVPPDTWLRIAVTIHWSRSGAGAAVLEVAGRPEFSVSVTGPNMYNSYQHYLKLGQYRHPDIATGNSIYIRNVNLTKIGGE